MVNFVFENILALGVRELLTLILNIIKIGFFLTGFIKRYSYIVSLSLKKSLRFKQLKLTDIQKEH
jgi:hypothetical protein